MWKRVPCFVSPVVIVYCAGVFLIEAVTVTRPSV